MEAIKWAGSDLEIVEMCKREKLTFLEVTMFLQKLCKNKIIIWFHNLGCLSVFSLAYDLLML